MSEKHYDIHYLEDTFKIMKDIKDYSYRHFSDIEFGTIVDLGCGTGKDVINMAALSPKAEFIGIDHDPKMIEQADAQKSDLQNVSFIEGEISPLPFNDDSIAGIRAERVFQHLQQPDRVLEEINRALMPDHPFVIVETDWDSISFYNAEIVTEQKIRAYLAESKVAQGKIAKQLTHRLAGHLFRNIRLEVFPVVLHSFQDACTYLWIDKIAEEMAYKGFLSQGQHDLFIDALKNADTEGYFACSINIATTFCVK